MPYIGKSPVGGGFHKLDALTASATATYALTLGSAAYFPETANQLLVSLNGVIQAPQDSFTVSGSNLVFDTALTSSDSIDFVVALGDVLAVKTVTDGAITANKIGSGAVTSAKLDTNIAVAGNLDVGTIRDAAGTNTAITIDSDGVILTPERPAFSVSHTIAGSAGGLTGHIQFNTVDTNINSCWDTTNYRFEAPVAGVYHFSFTGMPANDAAGAQLAANSSSIMNIEKSTDSGSNWSVLANAYNYQSTGTSFPNSSMSRAVTLDSGDYVRINVTTSYLYITNISYPYRPTFSGYLIG